MASHDSEETSDVDFESSFAEARNSRYFKMLAKGVIGHNSEYMEDVHTKRLKT